MKDERMNEFIEHTSIPLNNEFSVQIHTFRNQNRQIFKYVWKNIIILGLENKNIIEKQFIMNRIYCVHSVTCVVYKSVFIQID